MQNNTIAPDTQVSEPVTTSVAMTKAKRWLISKDKVPFYSNGNPRTNFGSPVDISQLSSLDEAMVACKARGPEWQPGFATGPDGNGGCWQGIDVDKIDERGLVELANHLPGYVEISRSGLGAHAIGYGQGFKTLAPNGSGIEAYANGHFFVCTGNVIRDAPLSDIGPFVEGALAPTHKANAARLNASASPLPIIATNADSWLEADLRSALCYISSDDRGTWIAVMHALKTLGPVGFLLFMEWSARSSKHRPIEDARTWETANPTNTSYAAVFEKAQTLGWSNPGRWRPLPGVGMTFAAMPQQIKLLTRDEVMSRPHEPDMVKRVAPWLGIGAIYGRSGSGKTFVALNFAAAIAEGEPWFGYRTRPRPVVIVGLEGSGGWPNRIAGWEMQHSRRLPDNMRLVLQPVVMQNEQDVRSIADQCPKGCLIIIDTLAASTPGLDENNAKDRGLQIEAIKSLQRAVEGFAMVVAHAGKDDDRGIAGHHSLWGALDAIIQVRRDGTEHNWISDKVREGEDQKVHPFHLATITLGADEDGDPVTTKIVGPADGTPLAKPVKIAKASTQIALNTFNDAARSAGELDAEGHFKGVSLEQWRPFYYSKSSSETTEAKKKAFQRARDDLIAGGHLTVEQDYFRLDGPNAGIRNEAIAVILRQRDTGTSPGQGGTCPVAATPP